MKFWHKIFFPVLIIFMVVFDAGALALTTYSYNFSRQREQESSLREQSIILSSIEESISNTEKVFENASMNHNRLQSILSPLADYYVKQGVFLGLFDVGGSIYSNTPDFSDELLLLSDSSKKNVTDRQVDGKRYVFIASQMPEYPHLTLVYARDITQIDQYRQNISRIFLWVSAAVFLVAGVCMYLILRHMTRPIGALDKITSEIAGGAYEKRVDIRRNDELGRLGQSFNRMADSVEKNVEQLTAAAEDRQQFIDDLAHEMKTPLTAVLGYGEYLQKAHSGEEERLAAAAHLQSAAQRLQSLSAKLLELTVLRHEELVLEKVNVSDLFDKLFDMMLPQLTERGLKLHMEAEINTVTGDETLLLSLLSNLVENAARASSSGDTISVKACKQEGAVFEVTDTGCGLDPADTEKILLPFYRADKSRSRSHGGAGLGLSIVAQIAERHNARIEIESEPAKGTTVRVIFTTF